MAAFLTKTFELDVEPGALPPILKVKQYDGDDTKEYLVTLYIDSQHYTIPSEVTKIVVEGSKPDGTGFSYDCVYTENEITFKLMRQMTVLYGDVICDFVFYDHDGNQISSHVFLLRVHRAAVQEDHIESTDDFQSLVARVAEAEHYRDWAKSYAVGGTGLREDEETNNSEYNWKLSKSYAVGGSGIRTGEDSDNASYYRTQSKSWAVGDTGEREGENSNNSKYWAETVGDARSQIDINKTNIQNLQSQIDQYVTPSTQRPDEVVNARVGFDGTVYPNLGTAIRTQMTKFGYVAANEEIYFSNNS